MRITLFATVFSLLTSGPVAAQARTTIAEGFAGWSGFLDETIDDFTLLGGRVRFPVTGRVSAGAEMSWLEGPGVDGYLEIDGVITIDVTRDRNVTPYIVAATGLLSHREEVGSGPGSDVRQILWFPQWHTSAGLGIRTHVADRVYVSGEGRVGSEGDLRILGAVGYRFGG